MVSAANVANAVGRFMIGLGLLVLAFAVFQLWGTSLAEAQAQDDLGNEFEALLLSIESDVPHSGAEPTGREASSQGTQPTGLGTTAPDVSGELGSINNFVPTPFVRQVRADQMPGQGEASGRLYIPALGVDKTIVHGVSRDDLRLGPGHYPSTSQPGQPGNAAIAGHRTTHGAPFLNLDRLSPGDDIYVQTVQGVFQYQVQEHEDQWGHPQGHFIVNPNEINVLDDVGDTRLTLTACHPRYSAAQRLIVTATLVSEPAPSLAGQETRDPDDPPGELVGEHLVVGDTDLAYAEDSNEEVTGAKPAQPQPELVDRTTGSDPTTETVDQPIGVVESLGWQVQHWRSVSGWALVTLVIAALSSLIGRRWRKLPTFALAAGPFLYCLYWTFTFLDKLLPAV